MFWEDTTDLCDPLHSTILGHLVSTQLRCIVHALLAILHIMQLLYSLNSLLNFLKILQGYSAMPRSKPKVKKLIFSNNGNCESMDKCKCRFSDKTSRTNHPIDTPFVVSVFLISFSFPISHCQLLYIIYWDYFQNQLPASKGPSAYFTVCFRVIQVSQRCKLTKRVACAKTLRCERERC